MKFRSYHFILFLAVLTSVVFSACFNDLDTIPIDEDVITSAVVYDDPDSYRQVLAKLYAGLALTGQQGPAGQSDISGIDEGFGQYLRGWWYHQEFPTEESVVGWNDQTIQDFHNQDWTSSDNFIAAFYSRIFYQISLCNEFIRETTDSKLDSRNVDANLRAEIQIFRAEARFLRALSYYHALDHFRNVPFVTEEDAVGAFFPEQIQADDLFNFIESELLAIENELLSPQSNEYGRADQGALWMLLAKMYLNSEVYNGKERNTDCIAFCEKVISAGYNLEPVYQHLFLADNHTAQGIIFPITYDGQYTKTWGGTTFIIHAGIGGNMDPLASGVDGGWGGTRATSGLVSKFPNASPSNYSVQPNPGNENYPIIYAPGSYQGFDPADDATVVVMASPENNNIYEGYIWTTDTNTEIIFTPQPNLDQIFGDNEGDGVLDFGGNNIVIADPGFYQMIVNINTTSYTIIKTDWGVIGSATADGWNSDQDMVFNPGENAWTIDIDLSEGELKFRANDDWVIDLGDTGADVILDYGGDNIIIPSNGSYTIKLFLDKPDHTYSIEQTSSVFDSRAMFHTDGQNLEITDIAEFTDGYAINKFKNVTRSGSIGSDLSHADTDFLVFRLADAYLMYAEAALRGGGGNIGSALEYVNLVRERAYQSPAGRITPSELTLDFILDERARELYWECTRRTDLVRFGKFSQTDYLWPWKGGVPEGTSTPAHLDVYPIPASDIGANPNLVQNPGY